ncbi:hypothetical protein GQR58_008461 [Nymphon striatum]|nr:hypothetical protein GQR58_008461 [Nymphon striatum]
MVLFQTLLMNRQRRSMEITQVHILKLRNGFLRKIVISSTSNEFKTVDSPPGSSDCRERAKSIGALLQSDDCDNIENGSRRRKSCDPKTKIAPQAPPEWIIDLKS